MKSTLFILLLVCGLLHAQLPNVQSPSIPTPTQTIYLSPAGNDSNSGTQSSPKRTFDAAVNQMSFGTPGVNGGNSYGEVILLSGDYYPTNSSDNFSQDLAQWRTSVNGVFVYKNISIRGLGKVVLHGDNLAAATQMIFLQGSGISVKNLRIENAPLHGILISGSAIAHHSDVHIDSVEVDAVMGFGILATGYDRVKVEHSLVNRACLSNENENANCQWPSGLRTDNCNHVSILNNVVSQCWGEGINTSLSKYILVRDNEVYDNYSVNIYVHSGACAIYSHNLIYNQDSTFFRYCYGAGGTSSGISVANELTCTNACFFWGNNCGDKVSCCAETDYDHPILTFTNYAQTDSIYIFNNVILNGDISVWDAFSGFGNYANVSNIFIEHNTLINQIGNAAVQKPMLSLNMGTPFVNFQNLKIRNNLISYNPSTPLIKGFSSYVPSGTCNGNWQSQISFSGNRWLALPQVAGLNFSLDNANNAMIQQVDTTQLFLLTPSANHPALIQTTNNLSYINDDFYHHSRSSNTNTGAIELNSVSSSLNAESDFLSIFPNPAHSVVNVSTSLQVPFTLRIFSISGELLSTECYTENMLQIPLDKFSAGLYILEVRSEAGLSRKKFLVQH